MESDLAKLISDDDSSSDAEDISVRTNTYTLFSTHSVPVLGETIHESLHKMIWNWCSFQNQWKAVLQ